MLKESSADHVNPMPSEGDNGEYDNLQLKAYSVFDESEDADAVVITVDDRRHLRVTRRALRIMDAFDGTRRLSDVRDVLAHGDESVVYDDAQLRDFVEKVLVYHGLLVGTSEIKHVTRNGSLWFRLPLVHTDKFAPLFRRGRLLYKPGAVMLSLLICGALIIASAFSVISTGTGPNAIDGGSLVLVSYISLVVHECGHVCAIYRYGLRAGRGGIGIYMFMPVFFVDLSGAWRLSARRRVVVDLGGMYFQILTTAPLSIMGLLLHNSRYCTMALSITLLTAINLLPFGRLDGYWILCDSLGLDNLSTNTWKVIKESVHGRRTGLGRNYELAAGLFALCSSVMIILGVSAAYSTASHISAIVERLHAGLSCLTSGDFSEGISILNGTIVTCIPLLFLILMIGSLVTRSGSAFLTSIRTSKGESTR